VYIIRKPEWKRQLGRARRRWEVDIRMDLRGVVWEVVDWIRLNEDRALCRAVVNTVMNHLVP
jgi:hypothetical protein